MNAQGTFACLMILYFANQETEAVECHCMMNVIASDSRCPQASYPLNPFAGEAREGKEMAFKSMLGCGKEVEKSVKEELSWD